MYQVDELFTPRELSVYLEIPVATLYAWRYRGQGPRCFRVGKHLRYRRSDVTDWISRQLESVSLPKQ
jgi:predicted DNA-binding transcriptional regulator AlpA